MKLKGYFKRYKGLFLAFHNSFEWVVIYFTNYDEAINYMKDRFYLNIRNITKNEAIHLVGRKKVNELLEYEKYKKQKEYNDIFDQ